MPAADQLIHQPEHRAQKIQARYRKYGGSVPEGSWTSHNGVFCKLSGGRDDFLGGRHDSVGVGVDMKYDAELTNAIPPGEILSRGNFGPWVAGEPGDTPLDGAYTLENADLGVFDGIAGILRSEGKFEGQLDSIGVRGQATVPDFRLKMSGNKVPLSTSFDVLVDGTNGNTVLRPVFGTLGRTSFTTSGGIIKHETDTARGISLAVSMPKGNLQDLLRLAMKGPSFMEGVISLKTRIDIPPLTGKVKQKLLLDGNFVLSQGKFLRSSIQDKIDTLSRRGQGQPKNEQIDEVVHEMKGVFQLNNEVMTFKSLSFTVPGPPSTWRETIISAPMCSTFTAR